VSPAQPVPMMMTFSMGRGVYARGGGGAKLQRVEG